MIELSNVSKCFYARSGLRWVVKPVNLKIDQPQNIALIGRNGAGKSTLLKMISGNAKLSSGKIIRTGKYSWPLGFSGSFHGSLSGAENVQFIADIFNVDRKYLLDFVKEFSELGEQFYDRFGTYSSGMKARLAFGASMGMEFDVYLIDEITEVGDARFKEKCREYFKEKMNRSKMIMVSHNVKTIRDYCDKAIVIDSGHLIGPIDVEDAYKIHRNNLSQSPS